MHERRNWLFIGSQLAGERAAVVMSPLQSPKLSGHEPWAYLLSSQKYMRQKDDGRMIERARDFQPTLEVFR